MADYSILVNTCDGFQDCWGPFFTLFRKYWPDCAAAIYLNTEYKDCAEDPGVTATKVCEKHRVPRSKRATWSSCLKWALKSIDTDIVLYMQEDYFLKGKVDNGAVEKYVALMLEHPEIKCLHLTDQAVKRNGASEFEGLDKVLRVQAYRVSCQAALWRKDELLRLINTKENPWEFEHFSSMRSSAYNHKYLVVSSDVVKLGRKEILPYVFTGIIKGKWKEEMKTVFHDNGIDVDFSKRGWWDESVVHPSGGKPSLLKRLCNRVDCLFIRFFAK